MNTKKCLKIVGKYLFVLFAGLIALSLIGLLVLHLRSPGKAVPFVDENGEIISESISTIEKVNLGGIEQYLIIRGVDSSKPVLLFLHGGPGSPELGFVKKYNPKLEHDFVVVHWEQRGSGKSYNKKIPIESMNVGQLISDTKELSEYLIKRFNQSKIYIMGHSWGSYLGMKTIAKYPELYHCYFGVGQVADQYRSERISYEWVKEQAMVKGDNKDREKLNAIDFPKIDSSGKEWLAYLMNSRNFVDKFGGGLFREHNGIIDKFSPVISAREYTLQDKINYALGSLFSIEHLWEEMITDNLFESIDSIKIPVYVFHGIYDYQTSYTVAKEFHEQLKAPKKQFFTFENSAHCPIFDDPERFNGTIRGLLTTK